ncbi:hypothetical protein V6N12_036858 [Hibiscus sabdariffa]|uniref:Uncharacterized protein n=1 Tax=Hibiscus sabdariffa TaxID=183260 RepID=A0ABR2BUZ2_9ROSI
MVSRGQMGSSDGDMVVDATGSGGAIAVLAMVPNGARLRGELWRLIEHRRLLDGAWLGGRFKEWCAWKELNDGGEWMVRPAVMMKNRGSVNEGSSKDGPKD